jgi:hypothetical protein
VQKRVLGEEHPDTLTTAANLANSLSRQGRHAEAETMQREVLAVRKRVLGEEHPDTPTTGANLADFQEHQGFHEFYATSWIRSAIAAVVGVGIAFVLGIPRQAFASGRS